MSYGKAKGGLTDGVSLPVLLESASVAFRHVANLKSVSQVEDPGQLNR